MRKYYFCIFYIYTALSYSQEIAVDTINYIKIIGDSVYSESIELDEILLLPKRPFKNSQQIREYLILKQKTLKVYPYSIIASKKLDSLNEQLLKIKTKRKRKKYTKSVQKFLEEEFTEELSKLKQSEGQILIKLIHRQTGETAYNLVKKLRNGLKALLYNVTAKVFNMNLKKEFLPYDLINDYYIEDIIQRGVRDKILEYRKPYKNYDLFKLKNKWE